LLFQDARNDRILTRRGENNKVSGPAEGATIADNSGLLPTKKRTREAAQMQLTATFLGRHFDRFFPSTKYRIALAIVGIAFDESSAPPKKSRRYFTCMTVQEADFSVKFERNMNETAIATRDFSR